MSLSPADLLAFNVVLLVALASPGAALIFMTRMTLASGRVAGIATGLGLGVAAAIWTLAALLGLEAMFTWLPWSYTALKIGGVLYLLWVIIQAFRHLSGPDSDPPMPRGQAFWAGLMMNLANPKSFLFAAAVIVVVFPADLTARDIALIVANHLALEAVFYTGFGIALTSATAQAALTRCKPTLNRMTAALLRAPGVRFFLEK